MAREEDYNSNLARLLREEGLAASAEARLKGRGKGFGDALVQMGRHRIIVEAKRGQAEAQRRDALGQCEDRLDNGIATRLSRCAIRIGGAAFVGRGGAGVCGDRRGHRDPHWQTGNPAQLAAAIRHAPAQLGNADLAAAMLGDEIQKAIEFVGFGQKEDLARALDLPEAQQPRRAKFTGKNAAEPTGTRSAGGSAKSMTTPRCAGCWSSRRR